MGRRSRKRSAGEGARRPLPAEAPSAAPRRAPAEPPRRRARLAEAPPAPWHPVPLVELTILVGIVLIVLALTGVVDEGAVLALGLVLVGLASLELSIREHFSGYRSHTSLLALVVAFAVGVPLWFTGVPRAGVLAGAALAGAAAWWALRRAFRRRAGGLAFRA